MALRSQMAIAKINAPKYSEEISAQQAIFIGIHIRYERPCETISYKKCRLNFDSAETFMLIITIMMMYLATSTVVIDCPAPC